MARPLWIPGVVVLVIALFLSVIVSVSLPLFSAMDIVRVTVPDLPDGVTLPIDLARQQRFGIWGACVNTHNDESECKHFGFAYAVKVGVINVESRNTKMMELGSSWTRGLILHPIASAAIALAVGLSFSSNIAHLLLSSFAAFFAAVVTLVAFAIDIALLAYMKNKLADDLVDVNGGPGFWLTFTTLILLLVAGCTVCFGHRKASGRDTNSGFPMSMVQKLPFVKKNEWA